MVRAPTFASRAKHFADPVDVGALAHEGSRNEVNALNQSPVNKVDLIFFGDYRKVDDATREA